MDTTKTCKDCGTGISKGKQLCSDCSKYRRKQSQARRKFRLSNRAKGMLPTWDANFKRDDRGNVIEKFCTTCKEWKLADQFTKRSDTASGLRSFCKHCEREYLKKYYKPKLLCAEIEMECVWCNHKFTSASKKRYCSEKCQSEKRLSKRRVDKGSIHVITEAECRNCGTIKPIQDFIKNGKNHHKIRPTSCLDCSKAKLKALTLSDWFKEAKRRQRKKRRSNPKHKIRHNLSRRFHELMKTTKKGGSHTLSPFIGCTTTHLRNHIESQFKRGQRWDNYGTKWHIDHIQPVASFDHNDPEQIKRCWHYTNLRPLCAKKNIEKSDSIIDCQPELLIQIETNAKLKHL